MDALSAISFYQKVFIILTLYSWTYGVYLALQGSLQLADSQRNFKGETTSSIFLHSFTSFFLVFLVGSVSADYGFIDKPLLRIFLLEAVENINGWKKWTWSILSFISLIILGILYYELMKFEKEINFVKKIIIMFAGVYLLQGIQHFYFEFIK